MSEVFYRTLTGNIKTGEKTYSDPIVLTDEQVEAKNEVAAKIFARFLIELYEKEKEEKRKAGEAT